MSRGGGESLGDRVESALGVAVSSVDSLQGGCIADVFRVVLADGMTVVAKSGSADLELERMMIETLASHSDLPVPSVLHAEPGLLLLEHIENDGRMGDQVERHAADLLASLHGVRGDSFGFDRDTLIGPLPQPCAPTGSWVEFFAERRIRHFGAGARESGAISGRCWDRLRSLADRLGEFLDEPEHPSLIHGDVWGGNVLAKGGRVAAFIDPAVHYAHPEVELAFVTLFSTFGRAFFDRYSQLRPLREGFFERRRGIYNVYPLLVHATLFGGSYGAQVERSLDFLD